MNFIYKRILEHYNYLIEHGFEVVCIMLQGSQNYNLDEYSDEYKSDVDTKAIVLPSFNDFIFGNPPISTTIVLDNQEHIDIKDIRIMFDMFKKQNISYIELLYSKYVFINPKYEKIISELFEKRDLIAAIDYNKFLKCIVGMAGNKLKALSHPYPNIKDKIDKFGYDGKQLSHLIRLFEFISRYTRGVPIEDCLITEDRELLLNIKKQLNAEGTDYLSLSEANALANFYFNEIKRIESRNLKKENLINEEGIKLLNNLQAKLIQQYYKEEILKNDDNNI